VETILRIFVHKNKMIDLTRYLGTNHLSSKKSKRGQGMRIDRFIP